MNKKQYKPAICCLGYNRPDSMRRLLNSIGNAQYQDNDVTLIISIDECADSDKVEKVANEFEWVYGEKIIKRYQERLGVRKHTLAIGDLSYRYGAVIYLEDDIVVSPGFYIYAQSALQKYAEDDSIFGVALYNQRWLGTYQTEFIPTYNGSDAFLFRGDISWGQCWIDKQWKKFHDWYDEHMDEELPYNRNVPKSIYTWNTKSSWSKFISFYMAETEVYYVVPYNSYSTCFSDRGVHTGFDSDQCQVPLSQNTQNNYRFNDIANCVVYDAFFERMDSFMETIEGIKFKDICMDLNGGKYDWSGYKAVLTTKKLDYKCINKYGINMDPIELNIVYDVPGEYIHLYAIPEKHGTESVFDKIEVPCTFLPRLFHQVGKIRTKNQILLVCEKIKSHIKR